MEKTGDPKLRDSEDLYLSDDGNMFVDNLPTEKNGLFKMCKAVNDKLRELEIQFLEEEDSDEELEL